MFALLCNVVFIIRHACHQVAVSLMVFHQDESLCFTLCLRLFAVAVHRQDFFGGRPADCVLRRYANRTRRQSRQPTKRGWSDGINLVVEDDLRHFADVFGRRKDFVFSQCVAVFEGVGKEADARVAVEQVLQVNVAGYEQIRRRRERVPPKHNGRVSS